MLHGLQTTVPNARRLVETQLYNDYVSDRDLKARYARASSSSFV